MPYQENNEEIVFDYVKLNETPYEGWYQVKDPNERHPDNPWIKYVFINQEQHPVFYICNEDGRIVWLNRHSDNWIKTFTYKYLPGLSITLTGDL